MRALPVRCGAPAIWGVPVARASVGIVGGEGTWQTGAMLSSLLLSVVAIAGPAAGVPPPEERPMRNPVHYFEIPVTDLDRAIGFYEAVLGVRLERRRVDGYAMALFPRADGRPGASGALAAGDAYIPARTGAIIYFDVDDIDATLARAVARGATILYPKTHVDGAGHVAEIEDSEGNRIALNQVD